MAHIAQHVLRNDLLYGLGATLFAALPPMQKYWQPIPRPPPQPGQRTVITTLTKAATVSPQPTKITAMVPETIYETVTKKVTSVSTDRYYLTKYTHYPIDTAAPCTTHTHTYYAKPTATSISNSTSADTLSSDATTADSPSVWETRILLALYTAAIFWLLSFFMPKPKDDEIDESNHHLTLTERHLEAERKRYTEMVDITKKLEAKMVQLTNDNAALEFRVKVTNILFQKLGVYKEGQEPDNETLVKMVEAKIEAILALRSEKEEQAKAIDIHEAAYLNLRQTIQERLNREWQVLLDQKQTQVDYWRRHLSQHATDAMKETENLWEENAALKKKLEDYEVSLEKTGHLPEENTALKKTLEDYEMPSKKQLEDYKVSLKKQLED